jgi:hypothetical protein
VPSCIQYCGYKIPKIDKMFEEGNRFSSSYMSISAIFAAHTCS